MILLVFLIPLCATSRVFHDSKTNEEKEWLRDVYDQYKDELRPKHHRRGKIVSDYYAKEKEIEDTVHKRTINKHKHGHLKKSSIHMPGVAPQEMDTYLCVAHKLPAGDRYIVEYKPEAKMQIAHHMLLFGCEEPFQKRGHWDCREMQPVCSEGSQMIMYAWAKDAPSLKMPNDVGFHVGGESNYKYLVLQVHYLNVSSFKDGKTKDKSGVQFTLDDRKKSRLAGIYLLANGYRPIPPHETRVHVDNGCTYTDGPTFKPFRFRVHAHKLGVVITAYRVRNGEWTIIGRGDPQKPQAFYKSANLTVKPGDTLMGRCTYNSTNRDRWTTFGATHNDEMCNFYIMYSYKPEYDQQEGPAACRYPIAQFFADYPKCSDIPHSQLKASGCDEEPAYSLVP